MLTHSDPGRNVSTSSVAKCNSARQLIEMWLHEKSRNTVDAYRRDVEYFLAFISGKPLQAVTLNDLQHYADALKQMRRAPTTVSRRLSAVKSLLTYGARIGYLAVNAGAAFKLPKLEDDLADRILSEEQVLRLIEATVGERNRVMLRFLYETGCRVSELVDLNWKNLRPREVGGQIRLFGKGSKTRVVLVSQQLWDDLLKLRGGSKEHEPVFQSYRSGKRLRRSDVYDQVSLAAKRAGIPGQISPHWLRHAHASHSIERGAPIHLVQATLGHSSIQTTGKYLHARPSDSSGLYLPK